MRAATSFSIACALLVLASLSVRVRALCAEPPPRPVALLASIVSMPAGASIVVDLGSVGLAAHPRIVRGSTPIALEVETVAPRLAVLTPARQPTPGRYALRDVLARELELDVTADPLPAAPAAPRLSRLSRFERRSGGGPGGEDYEMRLDAVVRSDPPEGTVALVASWTGAHGPDATWGSLRARLVDAFVLAYEAPCAGAGGTVAPRGTAVRLRYVDRFGQVSPETAPIRVR